MSKQELFDKFLDYMVRFAEIKAVAALKDGFILTLPLTLAGSVFLLIANLPIGGYSDFMKGQFGADWAAPLNQVAGSTFGILAILCVLGICYKYCQSEGSDAITASLLALGSFLIVTKGSVLTKAGDVVNDVIPKGWVGGNGVITAIIVSLLVAKVFCYCDKNHIGIKMPAGVPDGVAKAFAALVPGMIVFTGSAFVFFLCQAVAGLTFPEIVFQVLQTPLQNLTDNLVAGIIIAGIQSILFWAGIHGPNIVGGVVGPILTANAIDNQHLLDAGMSLIGNPQAKIITIQVSDVFIKSGGCGITLGLLISAFIAARSAQMKSISKLAFIPGLFNINEPIIFGLPIVFNPYFIFPFIGVPIIAMIMTYAAIAVGFMSPFSAVQVPWTTPTVIAGFLLAGWQGAVVQIAIVAMATAVYFPFMKIQDNIYYQEELDANEVKDHPSDPVDNAETLQLKTQ